MTTGHWWNDTDKGWPKYSKTKQLSVESSWNVMAHGDAREGKLRGNWRMEWVASTLHTTSEHGVSSIITADAHTSAASSRLNWRPPADLNGLVCFAERRKIWSLRVCHHISTGFYHFVSYKSHMHWPGIETGHQNWQAATKRRRNGTGYSCVNQQTITPKGGAQVQHYSIFNIGARWGTWLTPRPGMFLHGNDPVPIV